MIDMTEPDDDQFDPERAQHQIGSSSPTLTCWLDRLVECLADDAEAVAQDAWERVTILMAEATT